MKVKTLKALFSSLFLVSILFGCNNYDNLNIYGVKDYKFRGIKDGTIYLNLLIDIENRTNKSITIKEMKFKTWLNHRELGKLSNEKRIKLSRNKRMDYDIPLAIKLRTPADAFKLIGKGKNLVNEITIEGYIKGGRFLVFKKFKIHKQPISELAVTFKKNFIVTDTLSIRSSTTP